MNISILKKLIPGLLPLLIFILADEIWGTTVGLYTALIFGLGELAFFYIRDKKIDRFILLDTGLLVVLGVISIALDNDIFFRIKPAIIELIFLAIIGFSLWGPANIILSMSKRYTGDLHLNQGQEKMMRLNLKVMFWITAVHIVLVLYSARYMSDDAWAFISGALFYILAGAWFLAVWLVTRVRIQRSIKEEWFPVVNEEGVITGTAPRRVCHDGKSMLLHPVVHLHLFNPEGRLFLQKRSVTKDIQPGKWDTSVGGHISPGEKLEDALTREVMEEIGLKDISPRFIHRYVWESPVEKELVFSFIAVSDKKPLFNRQEIDDGRFWTIDEISTKIGKGIFTPNFEKEFSILKQRIKDTL